MIALLLLLLQAPGPQEAQRETVFGVVRTTDGAPWQGARVVLRSRPIPHLDVGSVDRVEVVSDAKGRFRASILRWRTYTAWARGNLDSQGNYRATDVVEHVISRTPVKLRELAAGQSGGTLQIDGLDAWRHRGPFRYRLAALVEHEPEHVGAVPADGRVPFPPLPGPRARIELFGKHEFPMHAIDFALATPPERIVVPRPMLVDLRPTLAPGAKFAGGRFVAAWRGRTFDVATVGEKLQGRAELPRGAKPWDYRLLARGFAPGVLAPEGNAAWTGQLVDGTTLRGRIRIKKGVVAARRTLWLRNGSYTIGRDSHRVGVWDLIVRTDRDGRFEVPSAQAPTLWMIAGGEQGTSPLAWLGRLPANGDVDLVLEDDLWLADIRLTTHAGVPAVGGRLVFEPGASSEAGESIVWTDRRGHARVLLPRGDLAVLARHGDAWLVQRVSVSGRSKGAVAWKLQLAPPRFVAGTLRDAAGKGVAGAKVSLWLDHLAPASLLGELRAPVDFGDFSLTAQEGFPNNRLQNLVVRELNRQSGRTDASGRFRFSVPLIECTFRAQEQVRGRVTTGTPIVFEGKSILDLDVRR